MPFYPPPIVSPASRYRRRGGVPVLPGRDLPQYAARRYPSDMTGAEWAVCEPLLPARRGGRARRPPGQLVLRDIVDAIRYLTHTAGVAARQPTPARGTVYWWRTSGRRTDRPSGCTMTCGPGRRGRRKAAPTAASSTQSSSWR